MLMNWLNNHNPEEYSTIRTRFNYNYFKYLILILSRF